MKEFVLNDGVRIPSIGFGTFKLSDSTYKCVKTALELGYRHIDTAPIYFNEKEVGLAINSSGISRDEIFVTSKLWLQDFAYKDALKAIDSSLKKLGLEYIDLYLIHQPYGKVDEAWKAMEEAKSAGKIRSIGVSNMTVKIFKKFESCFNIKPSVNQIEFHPFQQQIELRELMKKNGIRIEAWGPLYQANSSLLNNEYLLKLAGKYKKDVGQIILRFENQEGIIALPKSTHKERIMSNFDIYSFSLTDEEIIEIRKMNKGVGKYNPDDPKIEEWLINNFDVHKQD